MTIKAKMLEKKLDFLQVALTRIQEKIKRTEARLEREKRRDK